MTQATSAATRETNRNRQRDRRVVERECGRDGCQNAIPIQYGKGNALKYCAPACCDAARIERRAQARMYADRDCIHCGSSFRTSKRRGYSCHACMPPMSERSRLVDGTRGASMHDYKVALSGLYSKNRSGRRGSRRAAIIAAARSSPDNVIRYVCQYCRKEYEYTAKSVADAPDIKACSQFHKEQVREGRVMTGAFDRSVEPCLGCGEVKPIAEYHRKASGFAPRCRSCTNDLRKEYVKREDVASRLRDQGKRDYWENRTERLKQDKDRLDAMRAEGGEAYRKYIQYHRDRRKPRVGYVYVLLAPTAGRAKIGFTGDVDSRRFASIAAASPVPLIMHARWPATTFDERDYHFEWRSLRCDDTAGREWFHASEELIAWAEGMDQAQTRMA